MSSTDKTTKAETADVVQYDEHGFDIKNLTSVLTSLQLFRGSQKNALDEVSDSLSNSKKLKQQSSTGGPRVIGKVKKSSRDKKERDNRDIASDDEDILSKGSRNSRNSRKTRGSRLSKKSRKALLAQDVLAVVTGTASADVMSKFSRSSVPKNKIRDSPTHDSGSVGSDALAPPEEFYRYPRLLPQRDYLQDPVTGEKRPVWAVTIPIVCHKSNTPFYAQCSTAKQGYCTRCGVVRKGSQRTGSACNQRGCGERLTAKYHRWYPGLVRIEPLDKERGQKDYLGNKELFEKFGILWKNEDELQFVVDHYMLMKVYLVSPDFDIAPLHLERAYMCGVFAGRAFRTSALARKFLRDSLRLIPYRADFPDVLKWMAHYRANVVEEMNQIFFQGRFRCYFHAHQSNIEGWYDPTQVDPSTIKAYFEEICNRHIKMTETTPTPAPATIARPTNFATRAVKKHNKDEDREVEREHRGHRDREHRGERHRDREDDRRTSKRSSRFSSKHSHSSRRHQPVESETESSASEEDRSSNYEEDSSAEFEQNTQGASKQQQQQQRSVFVPMMPGMNGAQGMVMPGMQMPGMPGMQMQAPMFYANPQMLQNGQQGADGNISYVPMYFSMQPMMMPQQGGSQQASATNMPQQFAGNMIRPMPMAANGVPFFAAPQQAQQQVQRAGPTAGYYSAH